MPSRLVSCTGVLAVAAGVAACGSGGPAPHAGPAPISSGRVLRTAADAHGGLVFTRPDLRGRAGRITLVLANPRSTGARHGIAVRGHGVQRVGPAVWPGKTSRLTVDLPPGTYTLYCPVRGHWMAGMKGTLTVR